MNSTIPPPPIYAVRPKGLVPGMSDELLALIAPVVGYWLFCSMFHYFDTHNLFEQYRIHTPEELEKKNKATMGQVIRAVISEQTVQLFAGLVVNYFETPYTTGHEEYEVWKLATNYNIPHNVAYYLYWAVFPFFRLIAAFFVLDTWQYALHRYMHTNMWCYRKFHSVHHRLYVPYAFGALYNSLIEGFLLDTLSAAVAGFVTGMSPRELVFMYTFSTLKTVDDHCGYELPWDPLQIIFPNRATYHDIHHQHFGIKTNFSQPFFVHWDTLLGSKYAKTEEYIEANKRKRLENLKTKAKAE